ncbi:MAG: acetoacetate decarboxylase family protein [Acidimicrobiales bacterium]
MTESTAPTLWGEIQGQPITFPMEVPRMRAATVLYSVPADAAGALLPGDAFEVVEVAPGTAQLVVAACDYVDNPWGDYDEINLGFLARPAGAPPEVVGSFVYRMPVNQAFTCEAGNRVMGFPKTVEDLTVTYTDAVASFRLAMGGQLVLTLTLPRAEPMGEPARVEAESYSYLDGAPHATTLSMDMGTGVVDPAEVVLELGDSPVADELRSLGLPTTPDMATWGEHLSATFHLARPL